MLTGTSFPLVVPVAAPVTADETEALKAEITKAVKQVQEAGESAALSFGDQLPQGGSALPGKKSRKLLLK